jgi:hypothetical protein
LVYLLQVIEHKPYDHKADVFSFGILMWELLSGKVLAFFYYRYIMFIVLFLIELFIGLSIYCWQIPYEYLTPLQAAVGVVQKVILLVMIVVLFVIVMLIDDILTQHSCQEHITMTMILVYVLDQGTRIT